MALDDVFARRGTDCDAWPTRQIAIERSWNDDILHPQDDPAGSEHAVADVLRQMLAEERARSDQLPEAMTAWQLRARSAEERLVALSGASPTSSQATPPWSASAPAAPPSDRHGERDRTTAALPPAPHRDPVFVRHPLYRGRRYRQLVEDFANEAKGVQRQYSAFCSF